VVAPAAAPSRTRERLVFGGKVVVAAVLITWLVRSGSLDFKALDVFWHRPLLVAASIGLTLLGVVTGTLRWSVLLRLAGVHIPLGRAMQLQATAIFFNTAIPGNVGGDLVKSGYASREAKPAMRPTVFVIVFVERLLGLAGLVLVAGIAILLRSSELARDPQLRDLAIAVAVLASGAVVGPALFILFVRSSGPRLEKWTSGPSRVAKLAAHLVAAARLVSAGPKNLAIGLALSMLLHALNMAFFTALTVAITGKDVPFSAVVSIFPFGILTLVLPISPGGIGVGHAAFNTLFKMIGIDGGASIFNAYLVAQIAPALLGVFPYLALKRSHALPTEEETAASAADPPS
jgi:hypothetical protein